MNMLYNSKLNSTTNIADLKNIHGFTPSDGSTRNY